MVEMRMIEVDAGSPKSDPEFAMWAREMYFLLGANMTSILGHDGPDWRTEDEFRKWRDGVLLAGLAKDTCHLLLVDRQGLRGFLSFSVPIDSAEIYVNEIQIRLSARKDGVTFRRLMERFAARVANLPQRMVRAYANRGNEESQRLILKIGFGIDSQTERGTRFVATKAAVLERLKTWKQNRK